jgi:hypothetical protein
MGQHRKIARRIGIKVCRDARPVEIGINQDGWCYRTKGGCQVDGDRRTAGASVPACQRNDGDGGRWCLRWLGQIGWHRRHDRLKAGWPDPRTLTVDSCPQCLPDRFGIGIERQDNALERSPTLLTLLGRQQHQRRVRLGKFGQYVAVQTVEVKRNQGYFSGASLDTCQELVTGEAALRDDNVIEPA